MLLFVFHANFVLDFVVEMVKTSEQGLLWVLGPSIYLVKQFGPFKKLIENSWSIPYCVSLIMITKISYIFINIFQIVHFLSYKIYQSFEKNMSFLLIPKSQKVWKKSEQNWIRLLSLSDRCNAMK